MANGTQGFVNQLCNFKLKIRDMIREEKQWSRAIKVAARSSIYVSGEQDATVYVIESGQVKLVLPTPEGREYVMALRTTGDILGELCLSGQAMRAETAVATQDSRLNAIAYHDLLKILRDKSLLEELIKYLAGCIAQQQEAIGSLLVANSEQRLAKLLLQLGSMYGADCRRSLMLVPRILHEDLAAMVGTTRSRVGYFLGHFREIGLIEINADRSLTIETEKLKAFLRKGVSLENEQARTCRGNWPEEVSSLSQLGTFKKECRHSKSASNQEATYAQETDSVFGTVSDVALRHRGMVRSPKL
jgi:CRP/FNR family transcriptional regulator, cyclic AMP receptor protein